MRENVLSSQLCLSILFQRFPRCVYRLLGSSSGGEEGDEHR